MIVENLAHWRLRTRRAFLVPDLARDSTARRVIACKLTRETSIPYEKENVETAEALFDAFLIRAAKGQMEDVLFAEESEEREGMKVSPAEDWLAQNAWARILEQAVNDGLSSTGGYSEERMKMANRLVKTVVEHVREWPIENNLGEYSKLPEV